MRRNRRKPLDPTVWVQFFHDAWERRDAAERDMDQARKMVEPKIIVEEEYEGHKRSVLRDSA